MYENARIYQDKVIEMIEGQSGGWKPLSEGWITQKASMGGEPGTFRFTDDFLNYLKSDRSRRFVKGKYAESKMYVGARYDVMHDGLSGQISMGGLAEVLEEHYGRPLFSMAYERTKHEMANNWKKIALEVGRGSR